MDWEVILSILLPLAVLLWAMKRYRAPGPPPLGARQVSVVWQTPPLAEEAARELLARFQNEDDGAQRRGILAGMIDRYPDAPQTREAIDFALSDPDPTLRMLAARQVPTPRALPILTAVATDARFPPRIRVKAIEQLTSYLGPTAALRKSLAEILNAAAGRDLLLAALAAHVALGIVPPLARFEARGATSDDFVAIELARALRQGPAGYGEVLLLRMLSRDSAGVILAAIHALSRVGTVRAVEPLLALAESRRGDRDLRAEAEMAARFIQARLGPVEAGALSLSQPIGEGALTLAPEVDEASASQRK